MIPDQSAPRTGDYPVRQIPAAFRRQLEAVKDAVRIERVAQDYGEFKLTGSGRLLGRCISRDHEDRTPSFTIYTEEQRFCCYGIGCGAHGDVLDLVQLAEGCELWEAMMLLCEKYRIERPGRPESWFAKQRRQQPIRDVIAQTLFEHRCRRVFNRFFMPFLEVIEDPTERDAEAERFWEAAEIVVELIAEQAMGVEP